MERTFIPGVLTLERPVVGQVPVVYDSPHSGSEFPSDFGTIVPHEILKRVQDSYVDTLFEDVVNSGASLLRALFPRSYIDPNRAADDLELMNDPQLNIVSFRYNPGGLSDEELDALNDRLGEAVLVDGRFLVGTSKMGPRTIFRPAFSNWRTRPEDVEELAAVIREVAQSMRA